MVAYCQWCKSRQEVEVCSLKMFAESGSAGNRMFPRTQVCRKVHRNEVGACRFPKEIEGSGVPKGCLRNEVGARRADSAKYKKMFAFLLIAFFTGQIVIAIANDTTEAYALLTDEEPPRLVIDNTPETGITGGEMTFSANFTDNVSVIAAYVNYTHNDIHFFNLSMNNIAGEMWNRTITINTSAAYINYSYFFKDDANNTNTTAIRKIVVIDNIPPIADAGDDLTIKEDVTFYLDGTRSRDNVGIVNYTWWRWCPSCQKTYYYYGENPFVKHLFEAGNYTMTLNVTDAWNNSDEDAMVLTVIDAREPIAYAGRDIVIDQRETAFFNGNASWDNVGITNYTWSFLYDGEFIILYGVYSNYTFDLPGGYSVTLTTIDALGNTGPLSSDSLLVTVRDTTPPIAEAGDDIEIDQHETVVFNGSSSFDNIGLVNYYWSFEDNGSKTISGVNASYRFDNAGIFDVELEVVDTMGNDNSDTMKVTVNDTDPPLADAGDDKREINISDALILDGSGSTDNVGITNYTWSFIYNNSNHYLYGVEVTFRFYRLETIKITLTVTDGAGFQGIDICRINVVDKKPPNVNAGQDRTVDEGTKVTLDARGTRDHSSILYYNWSFIYNGNPVSLSGAIVDFTFDIMGTYTIDLEVSDIYGNTGKETLVIVVRDGIPPSAEAGPDMGILAGKTVVLNGSGSDNVGIVDYTWSLTYDGTEHTMNGKVVPFVFDIPGNYSVLLTTRDEANNTGEDRFWVNVTGLPDMVDDDDITDDTDDDNDVDRGEGQEKRFSIWARNLLIIISIIFVLMVILIVILRVRRGPPHDAGGEPRGKEIEGMELEEIVVDLEKEEEGEKEEQSDKVEGSWMRMRQRGKERKIRDSSDGAPRKDEVNDDLGDDGPSEETDTSGKSKAIHKEDDKDQR